jgi:hypothetical protein
MDSLEYSAEARNVLNLFYSVDKILYVEGEDDVNFWEVVFNAVGGPSVEIQEAGGKPQLCERMEEVRSGVGDYLVAIDADFDFFDQIEECPRIMRTYGYSIENTIVTGQIINRLVCSVAKVPRRSFPLEVCVDWLKKIEMDLQNLIIFDIVNRVDGLGHVVVVDNCDRFMKGRKSKEVCAERVGGYLRTLPFSVSEERELVVKSRLAELSRGWLDVLRGHFLMSLVQRYVKSSVARLRSEVSISREMFFGTLVLAFEMSFNEQHPHFEYYSRMVTRATGVDNDSKMLFCV